MLEKLERLERPDDQWQHAGKIGLAFQTGGDLGGKETIRAPQHHGRLRRTRRRSSAT